MWIPLELINYIFYLADNGKKIFYHKKRREYVICFDENHHKLVPVRNFFDGCQIFISKNNKIHPPTILTQICFPPIDVEDTQQERIKKRMHSMITIMEECKSPKTTNEIVHDWNRYFLIESSYGSILVMGKS